jgi:hypothetical protein
MKYKTRITPQGNNKYTGQLLEQGQVIYTTNELSDPILVSRELAQQVSRLTEPVAIAPKIISSPVSAPIPPPTYVESNVPQRAPMNVPSYRQNAPTKRCCGRG